MFYVIWNQSSIKKQNRDGETERVRVKDQDRDGEIEKHEIRVTKRERERGLREGEAA